jgi:hypothetical protein
MRYFSPNNISKMMFQHIQTQISRRSCEIRVKDWTSIPYQITPVLVLSTNNNTFHCHFMSNPHYYLDLDALDGSLFRYVYGPDGKYDVSASNTRVAQYTGRCYEHIRHDIYMPNVLNAGDILLCSRRGKGATPEPLLG